jgi:hypothetical protein
MTMDNYSMDSPKGTFFLAIKMAATLSTFLNTFHFAVNGFWNSFSGTDVNTKMVVPFNCTLKAVFMKFTTNGLNGNTIFTIKRNGVNSAYTFTLGAGVLTLTDKTKSLDLNEGDEITWNCDSTASSSGTLVNPSLTIEVVRR